MVLLAQSAYPLFGPTRLPRRGGPFDKLRTSGGYETAPLLPAPAGNPGPFTDQRTGAGGPGSRLGLRALSRSPCRSVAL